MTMSRVNKDMCIACGNCFGLYKNLFREDADGKAVAIKQPENKAEDDDFKAAMEGCPVGAISE
jgi:ferredoxin